MKKIIGSLLFLKLIVVGIIISMAINVHNFDQLLFAGTTDVHIVFTDADEGLEKMISLVEDRGLLMTKLVSLDYENLDLYATDVSFDDHIILSEGRFPEVGEQAFISNIVQDDEHQVGLIANLTPEFNITIRPMEDVVHFHIDGRYRLHTTDVDLLFELEAEMSDATSMFLISEPMEDDRTILETITMGIFVMPTVLTTMVVLVTPIVAFLCVGATLLQLSMSKAKESFTLHVHGFSQHKIILKSLKVLLKTMLLAGVAACLVLYGYLIISGLMMFHLQFLFIFLVTFGLIVLIYLVTSAIAIWLIFQIFPSHIAIKGYKPDFAIQILNHVLKVIFIALFLVGSHFVAMSVITLSMQRTHLQSWDIARHVHHISMGSFWPPGTGEFEQDMYNLELLRLELFETHQGFIMNAENFFVYDNFLQWENRDEHLPSFEVAPDGNRVDITLNYLMLNPIDTVSGMTVEEELIWDDLVINLLVPASLMPYERLIQELYLEEFYFGSLFWHERDVDMEGATNQEYTIDDLTVNIIYVQNDQYYFTFDTRIRPEVGNRVKDPIAVIHTGNFHPLSMMGLVGNSFYFISESENPFAEISDRVSSHGVAYSVRFSTPVFVDNIENIRLIEQDIISGVLILFALMITNCIVNYNLISNYFWRNKHTLFTKSLFGFTLLKRHKGFIFSFLIYVIPINIIIALIFGWAVLVMGSIFLVLDVILALSFEKRLMQKSFAEIMKGER